MATTPEDLPEASIVWNARPQPRSTNFDSTHVAEIDFVSASFSATCVESKFVDRGWGRAFQTIEASGRSSGVVATRSGLKRHDGGWA
ncbi:MAG: hypothetical protein R6T96_12385, partial [Longimicrobiales bacterium]